MEDIDRGFAKYELKSNVKLGQYFLRNLWIYLIYVILIVGLKIYEQPIFSYIPNIENVEVSALYNLVCIFLLVITILVYLKITTSSYKKNGSRKCTFYDTLLVYENPYAIIKTKDVTYENINKILVERNILDYIFKTGTIRIRKAVEYDEGMAIHMLRNPEEKLKDIQDIVKMNY